MGVMKKCPSPLVSVTMPIHGSVRWLREALESVRAQTFESWEFIGYVDGHNPEAEEILRSFGPRFTWTSGKERVGSQAANNQCISLANGRYVARLDSDDVWDKDHLLKSIETLNRYPAVVLVSSIPKLIDEYSCELSNFFKPQNKGPAWRLLIRNQIGHSGVVFRRALAVEAGMYNTELDVSYDYALWLRLARKGDVLIDDTRFFFYRIHENQMSSQRIPKKSLQLLGEEKYELAKFLSWPVWIVLVWHALWSLYCQFGPKKVLQSHLSRPRQPAHPTPPSLKSMRIMHVINALPTGGAEKLVVDLCTVARAQGHRPFIVCLSGREGVPKKIADRKDLKVFVLGWSRFDPRILGKLRRLSLEADIAHAHLFPALYWSSLLAIPKIVTEHSTINRRRRFFFTRFVDRRFYASFQRVVGISEGVSYEIRKHLEGTQQSNKIATIKNGIDRELYKSPRKRPSAFPRIAWVGSLTALKDPLLALMVIFHLPEATLSIFGGGPLSRELALRTRQLDLQARVMFAGEVDSVAEHLDSHDLLLSTSVVEGFGLVALEAQASGLPVIGPDVRGLDEVVIDGETGFLYQSRDPVAIASLIREALSPKRYHKFSENSVNHSRRFSIEKTSALYLQLYADILGDDEK